jgi:hypothetical protein
MGRSGYCGCELQGQGGQSHSGVQWQSSQSQSTTVRVTLFMVHLGLGDGSIRPAATVAVGLSINVHP